ncbi:MAG: UDP-N-acetylmuramate dehydrogenase [Actinomycetota bacterium]|nr:UDP-N-acetylmuramate dehydrogenase [Actinomycetota bacterium]
MTDRLMSTPGVSAGVTLAPMTTYKLGGAADWFAEIEDEQHLVDVLAAATGEVDVLVLGRGSNLLVADAGYRGLVIRLSGEFLKIVVEPGGVVRSGGAASLPRVARAGAEAGRCGLEFYAGIPGTVGGAVKMNAGGHGSDTAACLLSARIIDRFTGDRSDRTAADLGFGYRHSNIEPGDIVVSARFSTEACEHDVAEARIREITRWRKEHQPGGTFNAGSVFKNPPDDAAGRLIDAVGLKGYRRGGVAVSEMHANFLVADEHATAQDVWDLVWAVRRRVGEATGVWLVPEIQFAGVFDRTGDEAMGTDTVG